MKDIEHISNWHEKLKNCNFFIIAGPCAAESREQILQTAIEISKIPLIKIFRVGIWKPRTNPKDFQGIGQEAFKWLNEVKEKTNLLTCVEVANAKHLELCIKNNIDIVWLGARTTVNPFYVQEIANILKDYDIPVLVKNPIVADLKLWIGSIERLYNAGIRKIAAVARGFYQSKNSFYRNNPGWELLVELKTQLPNLPLIIDPSHITGKRELIEDFIGKSLAFCPDGFMIETHINPKEALSDSDQQITPIELNKIIEKYKLSCKKNLPKFDAELEQFRQIIDSIDYQILELLAKRFKIVEQVAYLKAQKNIDILQLERWKQILKSRLEYAQKLKINQIFTKKLIELVHIQSIEIQSNIINNIKNNKPKN